jgi:hypothetical protein
MNEIEQIVRDLAALSPIVESDLGHHCWGCGKVASIIVDLAIPEHHEVACVWRRAKLLRATEANAE